MSLAVKVALLKGEEASEYRRFIINGDEIKYETLERKIEEKFPEYCTIAWKDAEGDLVTFSSDEELKEAVKSASNGILKIFIIENEVSHDLGYSKNGQNNPGGQQRNHLGVMETDLNHVFYSFGGHFKHVGPKMKQGFHGKRGHFIRKLQNQFDEDDAEWFQRRQEKWMKRQEEKRAFRENCKHGNPEALQQRLDRLKAKLSALHISELPSEEIGNKTAEREVADHLEKRIEHVKAKLENVNGRGDKTISQNCGKRMYHWKTGTKNQQHSMGNKDAGRVGRVELKKNHAVIKIPLKVNGELAKKNQEEINTFNVLQQRLGRLKAKLAALDIAEQPADITRAKTTEQEIADHLGMRIERVKAKIENLKVGGGMQKLQHTRRRMFQFKTGPRNHLEYDMNPRQAWPTNRVELKKNHAVIKLPIPLKFNKDKRGNPAKRQLKLRIKAAHGKTINGWTKGGRNLWELKQRMLQKQIEKLEGKKEKVQMKLANGGYAHVRPCFKNIDC